VIAVVVIEVIGIARDPIDVGGYVEVGPAVVVIVPPRRADAVILAGDAQLRGDVLELAVPLVVEQLVRPVVGDVQIEQAVVVIVGDTRSDAAVDGGPAAPSIPSWGAMSTNFVPSL